ncbi:FAD/NAD(P)-binding domain-containing protein [Aspergillus sclerotiicarbonarius CBS 121057]|uniref:FAD/NAD(P)-binding domain-containing protein n=1 Tax=Aspergillus sclerotiicarbonarius (strain CBS 121057 / IBT 28362) TaxID=1448318 RepID=A0A319EEI1_ASPSB|nr:FAD/NAD(P)-binding domain-containing protein [Aspergillus sclerotiicarbonarius CBS 121057]
MLSHTILILKTLRLAIHQLTTLLHTYLLRHLHKLTYRPVSNPKTIVLIGASFAGYHAARCLTATLPTGYRVVVVEKNSHFQLTWVLPRFSVVPGHEEKGFIPYTGYLGGGEGREWEWVRGRVVRIITDEGGSGQGWVEVEGGGVVEYEYLVLATGAVSESGLPARVGVEGKEEGMKVLMREQERVRRARDVVVVGGGAAGVEMAGDVKGMYPGKNVTLVHSRERLLNRGYGVKLGERVLKELEGLGVRVVLGERVVGDDEVSVRLTSGEVVAYDYLVKCVGQRPNSDLLRQCSPLSVSETGHVRVRSTLQIADEAYDCIYAAGDLIETDGIQNARAAFEQAQVVAANIVRSIKGKTQKQYRPQWWEAATKLTVGLNKSVAYIGDGAAELVIGTTCGEDLDGAMVWRFLGAKPYEDA